MMMDVEESYCGEKRGTHCEIMNHVPEEIIYEIVTFLPPSVDVALVNQLFYQIYKKESYWKLSIVNRYKTWFDSSYMLDVYLKLLNSYHSNSAGSSDDNELTHLQQIYSSLKYHPTRFYTKQEEESESSTGYASFPVANGLCNTSVEQSFLFSPPLIRPSSIASDIQQQQIDDQQQQQQQQDTNTSTTTNEITATISETTTDSTVNSRSDNSFMITQEYQISSKLEHVLIEFKEESINSFNDQCIRTSEAIPHPEREMYYSLPVWYMEFTIAETIPGSYCSVGLGYREYSKRRQPGWNYGSIGYHGDDGGVFCASGSHDDSTDRYDKGDTVGLGCWFPTNDIFVTKNGKFLKVIGNLRLLGAGRRFDKRYVLMGFWDKISCQINFGSKPFLFNLSTDLMTLVQRNDVFVTGDYSSEEEEEEDFLDSDSDEMSIDYSSTLTTYDQQRRQLVNAMRDHDGEYDEDDDSDLPDHVREYLNRLKQYELYYANDDNGDDDDGESHGSEDMQILDDEFEFREDQEEMEDDHGAETK